MGSLTSALFSAGMQMASGNAQAAALKGQRNSLEVQAQQEIIRGKEEGNNFRERLIQTLATQSAIFGAAGITPEGTPSAIQGETMAAGGRELDTIGRNARIRAGSLRSQSREAAQAATLARDAGYARAGLSLFDFADRTIARGPAKLAPVPATPTGPGGRIAGPV